MIKIRFLHSQRTSYPNKIGLGTCTNGSIFLPNLSRAAAALPLSSPLALNSQIRIQFIPICILTLHASKWRTSTVRNGRASIRLLLVVDFAVAITVAVVATPACLLLTTADRAVAFAPHAVATSRSWAAAQHARNRGPASSTPPLPPLPRPLAMLDLQRFRLVGRQRRAALLYLLAVAAVRRHCDVVNGDVQ